jgi:transposase, IS30 family
MSYRQLTQAERYHIQVGLKNDLSQAEIARRISRDPSTVAREIRRNRDPSRGEPYLAERAQRFTRQRRVTKGEATRKIQGELQVLVESKLRLSWSPQQISGRLRAELGIALSHETIYQHVIRDAKSRGILRYCLRFGGYKHHRCKKSQVGDRTRARKNWIDQRPAEANDRTEIGHWERDCVLGERGGAALLTIVDRRTRFTRIRRVVKVNTSDVAQATMAALAPHRSVTRTITNDNGVEFQRDEKLQAALGVPIYFTDPSSPWQRGSIENLNGLVRQYIPKGTDLDSMPTWTAQALEETLNFRPRKVLGFKTPHECFFAESIKLMKDPAMHFGLEFSLAT